MIKKINIKQLKEDVNLFLYDKLNCGIDKLRTSSEIIEKLGGKINEQIDIYNSNLSN